MEKYEPEEGQGQALERCNDNTLTGAVEHNHPNNNNSILPSNTTNPHPLSLSSRSLPSSVVSPLTLTRPTTRGLRLSLPPDWPTKGLVQFSLLSMRYRDDTPPVLRQVTHPLNPPPQHALSTHPLNTPSLPTPSQPTHSTSPPLSTCATNTPSQPSSSISSSSSPSLNLPLPPPLFSSPPPLCRCLSLPKPDANSVS